MENGLAEVLVLRREEIVLRIVFLRIGVAAVSCLDVVVERIPVRIVERCATRTNHFRKLRISQPRLRFGSRQLSRHDLATLKQLCAERRGFRVERFVHLLNMDVVDIPIGRVALEYAIGTRLPIGQDIRAAIQIGVVARAEILAHLFAEFAVARHEADVGKHGFKVGDRLFERVFQRVIVNRLDADIFPITFAVKVRFSVFDDIENVARLGNLRQ